MVAKVHLSGTGTFFDKGYVQKIFFQIFYKTMLFATEKLEKVANLRRILPSMHQESFLNDANTQRKDSLPFVLVKKKNDLLKKGQQFSGIENWHIPCTGQDAARHVARRFARCPWMRFSWAQTQSRSGVAL